MTNSVLVGYATRYGSTEEVAQVVAETLREAGNGVDLQTLRGVRSLANYRAIVLGAPLFMFHWHKDALGFLSHYRGELLNRPVAVFALGPVHDPHDENEWRDSRAQLAKELAKFPWFKPIAIEMFGGKYDPARLGFPLNKMAGKEPASDVRDWPAIRAWAMELGTKLGSTSF
jgi:menaquinone-dependent protoporphyrinogen oxidase